jgi:hypothetical protein
MLGRKILRRIIVCPVSGNFIEEFSGEELFYGMFLSVEFLAQDFRKNFIDKLSGRRIIRRRIFHLQGFFSIEELSGEEYS